jgi:hypothetical protein
VRCGAPGLHSTEATLGRPGEKAPPSCRGSCQWYRPILVGAATREVLAEAVIANHSCPTPTHWTSPFRTPGGHPPMTRAEQPSRRSLLAVAVAAATAGAASPAAAAGSTDRPARTRTAAPSKAPSRLVDNHAWTSYTDWRGGTAAGTRAVPGVRPGPGDRTPEGRTDYKDPHTGTTATWEYARWTSPVHRLAVPATEVIPPGTRGPRRAPGSRSSCRARTPTARPRPGT